jgi:hypothetical protein
MVVRVAAPRTQEICVIDEVICVLGCIQLAGR